MTARDPKAFCSKCGQQIYATENTPNAARTPCPKCDSTSRTFEVEIEARLSVTSNVGMRGKHSKRPSGSKRKWGGESTDETQFSHQHGRHLRVQRYVDRDSDQYYEKLTDPSTGEVLKEVREPLRNHEGHGDAKRKNFRREEDA